MLRNVGGEAKGRRMKIVEFARRKGTVVQRLARGEMREAATRATEENIVVMSDGQEGSAVRFKTGSSLGGKTKER